MPLAPYAISDSFFLRNNEEKQEVLLIKNAAVTTEVAEDH